MKTIAGTAFSRCTSLTRVVLPKSVTSIPSMAFPNCASLSEVYFLGSLVITTAEVFPNCGNLDAVCVPPDYPSDSFGGKSVNCNTASCVAFRNMFDHCHEAKYNNNIDTFTRVKRENATMWELQSNLCKEYQCNNDKGGVSWSLCNSSGGIIRECINDQCSERFDCGKELICKLNDGILRISGRGEMYNFTSSNHAPWYNNLSSIENIVIEDGVTSIGNGAFSDCSNLEAIAIGRDVLSIGNNAFQLCDKLNTIEVLNDNMYFKSIDGVLFDHECSTLLQYPMGNSSTLGEYGSGVTCAYCGHSKLYRSMVSTLV